MAGPYTLDFVSIELKLDVEIDGEDHLTEEGMQRDAQREAYLRKHGYTILRINGFRVTQDPMTVRNEIERVVRKLREESPSPKATHSSPPTPFHFVPQGRGEHVS